MGGRAGRVLPQGRRLADLFGREGYQVISVSSVSNRIVRLCDIATTLLRNARSIDVQILDVFSGDAFVVTDMSSRIGAMLGQRLVMVLRGGNLPDFIRRHPRWSADVLRRADVLVAPSGYLAEAVSLHGFSATIIPNVIDIDAYPYQAREHIRPRLLWMRAFHSLYNPDLAIRALALVRKTVPEVRLVMAGPDSGSEALVRRLALECGVAESVRFVGVLDMNAKLREGDAADVFLNTNRVDNMPVSVLEAAALGLPVVATAVGGVPYLLQDGETGLLTPDDDPGAIAHAVLRLLREPTLALRLSKAGRHLAESCSWPSVKPQWECVFQKALHGPAPGA